MSDPHPRWWSRRLQRWQRDRRLAEEVAAHLAMEVEANERRGMTPEAARHAARRAFGPVEQFKEEARDAYRSQWVEESLRDLHRAARALARRPATSLAAVLTVALGVGGVTAILSVVDAVIVRPLALPGPAQLVALWEERPGDPSHLISAANYLDWRVRTHAFRDVAAYTDFNQSATLIAGGAPLLLRQVNVSGNFFATLGVRAALGRTLRDEETWQTGAPVAVISHELWQRQLGGDSNVVGRTVQLDGQSVQVVGVLPAGFAFPSKGTDIWSPFAWDRADANATWFRRNHWVSVVARLNPGTTLAAANADLQGVVSRLRVDHPVENPTPAVAAALPLHDFVIRDTRTALLLLLGAVAMLLLIACANVANLKLVQAAERQHEAAMCLALGARRSRLVRQSLSESAVIAVAGGGLGVLLGLVGMRGLLAVQPRGMGALPVGAVSLNASVLTVALALTTVTGLVFGLLPALWTSGRRPADVLKEGGRRGSGGVRLRRWGDALAISEVALALLLMLGASLLVRSYRALQNVPLGFDPEGVLLVTPALPPPIYYLDGPAGYRKLDVLRRQILERIAAVPGVRSAGATTWLPAAGSGQGIDFSIEGRPADQYGTHLLHALATTGFFTAMRLPIVRGRAFDDRDSNVIVINATMARRFFGTDDPIGHRITFARTTDSHTDWHTIVGVMGDVRDDALSSAPRLVAVSPLAEYPNGFVVTVRTDGDPMAVSGAIGRIVAELQPSLALRPMQTMVQRRAASLEAQRYLMTLLLAFAGTGLLLALVGVYGVVAQLARQRTREIGIRLALGARSSQARWLVLRHGLRLVVVASLIGTGGALLAGRAMRSVLFEVAPFDPPTFIATPLILAVAVLGAMWLPAWRIGRLDPVEVLRAD